MATVDKVYRCCNDWNARITTGGVQHIIHFAQHTEPTQQQIDDAIIALENRLLDEAQQQIGGEEEL